MSKYIDADALMHELKREVELADDWKTAHEIANVVKYFPTADVVEVVRCRDCEFWQDDWIPNTGGDRGCHYCEMMDSFTEPLNYCGYAERKILPKD